MCFKTINRKRALGNLLTKYGYQKKKKNFAFINNKYNKYLLVLIHLDVQTKKICYSVTSHRATNLAYKALRIFS